MQHLFLSHTVVPFCQRQSISALMPLVGERVQWRTEGVWGGSNPLPPEIAKLCKVEPDCK